jgi:hypothetical protein
MNVGAGGRNRFTGDHDDTSAERTSETSSSSGCAARRIRVEIDLDQPCGCRPRDRLTAGPVIVASERVEVICSLKCSGGLRAIP